jgi:hypothetical protein
MAKIILVSKHVTATSWQLAQSLRAQQHDVILLTSYGEPAPDTTGIQFMAYFKKWSFWEGLKIIPGLFGLQPQILHLILDEDRINPAMLVLSTFAKSHPTCILTTSLLNIERGLHRKNPVRYLVEESDIVTCPSVENLGQLRGLNVRVGRQGRGILPPVLKFTEQNSEEIYNDGSEAQLLFDLHDKPYFVIPFREPKFLPESDNFARLRTLAQKHKVVLWGSFKGWSLRDRKRFATWMQDFDCGTNWMLTGELPQRVTRELLEHSTAFVLAGQKFTPLEMTEYYMRGIQAKSVMILDSLQTSIHSDLWRNSVNCWVLDHAHMQRDLIRLLSRHHLELPENLSEQVARDSHLIDSSLNELNRLYNKALQQKSWS